ncbi:MAG: phosphatidylserine decarboxylase family protein [Bacteroidetes bacterium]|nr:phosphatidylserine decarboxylase family protein [Bacteroidota bacterium]MCH8523537.1 phosphatidylserine decarboxylase family protein [Balneolales bacterium]
MKFAKDGYDVILKASVISAILLGLGIWLGGIWLIILGVLGIFTILFTLYFFRDPDRSIPQGEHYIIAPADGKVIDIRQVQEKNYFKGEVTQVSIFLSPLDVHVNRNPISGLIEYAKYYPGEYLVAWHEKASELNERSEFGVLHASGARMLFRQITGYVARRITFHIKQGDTIKAGDRFGMMKFGSRMDLLYRDDIRLNVKPGDRIVAGETIIGEVVIK